MKILSCLLMVLSLLSGCSDGINLRRMIPGQQLPERVALTNTSIIVDLRTDEKAGGLFSPRSAQGKCDAALKAVFSSSKNNKFKYVFTEGGRYKSLDMEEYRFVLYVTTQPYTSYYKGSPVSAYHFKLKMLDRQTDQIYYDYQMDISFIKRRCKVYIKKLNQVISGTNKEKEGFVPKPEAEF